MNSLGDENPTQPFPAPAHNIVNRGEKSPHMMFCLKDKKPLKMQGQHLVWYGEVSSPWHVLTYIHSVSIYPCSLSNVMEDMAYAYVGVALDQS